MAEQLLELRHEDVTALAEEIAAFASFYHEGDMCELVLRTARPPSAKMLAEIRDGVRQAGAELTDLRPDAEGVHIQVRVAALPLLLIAALALAVLIPAGVIGWRLLRWTPEEMTGFLIPFALITVGVIIAVVRPSVPTLILGGGLVAGGAYLALRKPAPPPTVRASITNFTWEQVEAAAALASSQYALAGR